MTDEIYGLMCFDREGNLTDHNLDSVLIAEGVLVLGNQKTGFLDIDILFPLRSQFRGIFMMPLVHSFTAAVNYEYAGAVYWSRGKLCWDTLNRRFADLPWHGGAFAGRQFLYGYYN